MKNLTILALLFSGITLVMIISSGTLNTVQSQAIPPQVEKTFNLRLTYTEIVNVVYALKYNSVISADAANRLSDKINAQAIDTAINPLPTSVKNDSTPAKKAVKKP